MKKGLVCGQSPISGQETLEKEGNPDERAQDNNLEYDGSGPKIWKRQLITKDKTQNTKKIKNFGQSQEHR